MHSRHAQCALIVLFFTATPVFAQLQADGETVTMKMLSSSPHGPASKPPIVPTPERYVGLML